MKTSRFILFAFIILAGLFSGAAGWHTSYHFIHHSQSINHVKAASLLNHQQLLHNGQNSIVKEIGKDTHNDSKRAEKRHKKTRVSSFITDFFVTTVSVFYYNKAYCIFSPGYFPQFNVISFSLRGPPVFA